MNNKGRKKSNNQKQLNKKFIFILFLVMIFLSLQAATQIFAINFQYQAALGNGLVVANHKIYPFWSIILWVIKYYSIYKDELNTAITIAYAIPALYILLVAIYIASRGTKRTANETLHGSARFAEEKDIKKAGLLEKDGVIVGAYRDSKDKKHYLYHNGPEHILVYAPTRSGKGVGLIIPTLLTWQHSMICSDIKGELWNITSGWRKEYANNICIKFEPASLDSAFWNPFDEIRVGSEFEVSDVQNLATLIVDPDGKGLNDHWSKTAFSLLTGCILHLLYKNKLEGTPANMAALDAFISDTTRPIADVWMEMKNMLHTEDENGNMINHPVVGRAAQDMLDKPEAEAGSVLSTAKSFLSLYRDPIVERNTSKSSFKISDLMNYDKPISLYIVTQPADKDRLRPLIRILVNMIVRIPTSKFGFFMPKAKPFTLKEKIIRFIQGKSLTPVSGGMRGQGIYKHRLLLMLDEFPSLGKLSIVQEGLAYIAGYGLKAYIITQDITQLRSEQTGYGKDEVVSSNCHIQIAFAPNRQETAEYLSKMTGETTIVDEQITESGGNSFFAKKSISKVYRETKRNLMTPEECLHLQGAIKDEKTGLINRAGEMLVFVAGFPVILGEQPLYFQDERWSARASVPPCSKTDVLYNYNDNEEYFFTAANVSEEAANQEYDSAAAEIENNNEKP